MDIPDQFSYIAIPCSAAPVSQRTHGRLDGMARPPDLAMVKFIAGGWVLQDVELLKRR